MVTTSLDKSPTDSTPDGSRARLRGRVIDILELLQVPTTRRLLQDTLAARGASVELGELSRLCRAEEHALHTGRLPDGPALVPAISCLDLTAIPGTFTCSTWTFEQRLVGTYTPRTRLLRVLLRLLHDGSLLASEPGERLITRLAETVPEAMQRGRMRAPLEVRAAAQAELDVLDPLDRAERNAAAGRAATLAPSFQLWGQPMLLAATTNKDGAPQT
jgi:hypothetical protein